MASSIDGNNQPRIVLDAGDNPLVIWGSLGDLKFSKRTNGKFSTPINLNPDGIKIAQASWMGPDIASQGDLVYVVYKQLPEGSPNSHIYCIKSTNGGASFSAPVRVDYINDSLSRFPTVAIDDIGNPVVGFMKFHPGFTEPNWVVCRSLDGGESFNAEVAAGNWSSSKAEACDCCPGDLEIGGANTVMAYRDNDENIRDIWLGVSVDSAKSFKTGFNADDNNWLINSCPASGPDVFILGDSVYSVFMNGASGSNLCYMSRSSLNEQSTTGAYLLSYNDVNISKQNYPRIDNHQNQAVSAWQQVRNNQVEIGLSYTRNIVQSSSHWSETIATSDVRNVDLAMSEDSIFMVWQNNTSSTVKFMAGSTEEVASIGDVSIKNIRILSNPTHTSIGIESSHGIQQVLMYNAIGTLMLDKELNNLKTLSLDLTDWNVGVYTLKLRTDVGWRSSRILRY